MSEKLLRLLAALTACLSIIASLGAEDFTSLDRFIEKARVEYQVPGAAVSIIRDDSVRFIKGYGVLEYGKEGKVDEDTVFQLASVSKTFTAAAVGALVDRKELSWNDEVIAHLPAFALSDPYATRYSTAIDLLAHRTGLPAFQGDLLGLEGFSRQEILRRIRFIPLSTSFREKAQYSNVGFFAAGELAAALGSKPFEEVVKETLLYPAKMERTGFGSVLDGSNVASTHAMLNGSIKVIERDRSILFAAAGGVASTAADLARWMRMHLNKGSLDGKQILSKETVATLFQPAIVSEIGFSELPPISTETGFSYGLGWNVYYYKGFRILEKGGALDGVRSLITLIPEKNMGIAILANLNLTVLPELVRTKFLNDVFNVNDPSVEKTFADANEKLKEILAPPKAERVTLPQNRPVGAYAGVFTNEAYGELVITPLGNGTFSAAAGPAKWQGKLTHFNNDTFLLTWPYVNYGNQEATYMFGPDGKAVSIRTETLGTFTLKQPQGVPSHE